MDGQHPHVLRVLIIRSWLDRVLKALITRLPKFAHTWIASSICPGLFLPDRVVLKQCKLDWEAFWGREKAAYDKLKHLQGRLIPILHGEAESHGRQALVLSEIVGTMPWEQGRPLMSVCEFRQRVAETLKELHVLGLAYWNVQLDHIILVEDRVVLVDLEEVHEVAPEERERVFESDRACVEDVYSRFLDCR